MSSLGFQIWKNLDLERLMKDNPRQAKVVGLGLKKDREVKWGKVTLKSNNLCSVKRKFCSKNNLDKAYSVKL